MPAPRLAKRTGEVGPVKNPGSLTFATEICLLQSTVTPSVMLGVGICTAPVCGASSAWGQAAQTSPLPLQKKAPGLHKEGLWEAGKALGPSVQPDATVRADGVAGGCRVQVASRYFALFSQGFLLESQHRLLRAALRTRGLVK